MPREWMNSINGVFPTPFGEMEFAITQGDHVHISAGSQSETTTPRIVVNGVRYYTSLHLFRQLDGAWVKRPDSSDPYMSREGAVGRSSTTAAEKKAYEGIRKAWEQFIAGDEAVLIEAERRHLNNEIHRADDDIREARAALEVKEDKRAELLKAEKYMEEKRAEIIKRGGYPNPRDWSPRGEIPGEE